MLFAAALITLLGLTGVAIDARPSAANEDAGDAHIDFLTRHREVWEGEDMELKCVVSLADEDVPHRVEWLFVAVPEEEDDEEGDDGDDVRYPRDRTYASDIAANSRSDRGGKGNDDGKQTVVVLAADESPSPGLPRVRSSVRRRWDAVDDVNVEEHYLRVKSVEAADQGMYICQVKRSASSVQPLDYAHCIISVTPFHLQFERIREQEEDEGGIRPIPTAVSAPLTKTSREVVDGAYGGGEGPTLGPITERFVVATRGTNVVLECRDADGAELYWKKQGDPSLKGTGKRLKLLRVDRWDSGMYYCSTNTSFNGRPIHNVTLQVDHPPKVEFSGPLILPKRAGQEDRRPVARQAVGYPASITCRVQAVPVPKIFWYRIPPPSSSYSPNGVARPAAVSRGEDDGDYPVLAPSSRNRLHSGDDLSTSISAYKDGLVESTVVIPEVGRGHFGTYVCEAENAEGRDAVAVEFVESDEPVSLEGSASDDDQGGSGADNQRISIFVAAVAVILALEERLC